MLGIRAPCLFILLRKKKVGGHAVTFSKMEKIIDAGTMSIIASSTQKAPNSKIASLMSCPSTYVWSSNPSFFFPFCTDAHQVSVAESCSSSSAIWEYSILINSCFAVHVQINRTTIGSQSRSCNYPPIKFTFFLFINHQTAQTGMTQGRFGLPKNCFFPSSIPLLLRNPMNTTRTD